MSIVPINIRPHLIPFFFKEFEVKEAVYLNLKVNAVKISTKSSLGKMIRMFMVKVDKPIRAEHYQLHLSVIDTPKGKVYEGSAYAYESGAKSFLRLQNDANIAINELLEDIFRTSFNFFVEGYMQGKESKLTDAINFFIEKYDLLEFGYCHETMRQLYYREKKKTKLNRFQIRSANRVNNN